MSGFISLVGSGPGDPELLTLKAVDRLQRADVVLFDDLSSGPILSHAKQGAELIAVGKRAGRNSPKQDHISRLIVDYAKAGNRVVRLKSGDPGIFGRLDEETDAAIAAGLPYEVIPGVTSASAAVADLGISLTKRGVARRVQFVTGHDYTGQLPEGLRLEALTDPNATTVIYMGKGTFPALATQLIEQGLPKDMPACLVAHASLPDQQSQFGTVESLAQWLCAKPELGAALIVIGAIATPRQHGGALGV